MIARRSFLLELGAAVCAPAIIRPGLLMPVKRMLSDGVALTSMPHPIGGPIPISKLRELLLPGLMEVVGNYERVEDQWFFRPLSEPTPIPPRA